MGSGRGSRLCDAASGKQTVVCEGHRDGLWTFAFSPDGTRLASGGEDRTARLWDAATGALLATCRGHASKVIGVAFSPDGTRLLTTSADGTVRQWDVTTGREVEPPYDRHSGDVTAAVYSPDGQWVASAGTDRTVRVWQARGRQDVAVLHGHTGNVTGVAFAPDGRRLASLSRVSAALHRGRRHGPGLGSGPPGDAAGAARPHQRHLPGGLQPGRPLDRLGGLGQHGALVGCGHRRALRDLAPPRCRAWSGLRPRRNLAGHREHGG